MFCLLSLGDNMDWLLLFIILLLQLSLWISSEQKLDACGLEGRSEADAIFLILFGNFFWYASSWKRRVLCSSISLLVFQLPKSKVDESRWQYVLKKGGGGEEVYSWAHNSIAMSHVVHLGFLLFCALSVFPGRPV